MPRLDEILNQVMANPVADPGPLLHPVGDEVGAPAQPSLDGNAVATNGEEPESEEVLLALQFAETSLDHHGLEGSSRDAVRRFVRLNALYRLIELYIAIEALKNRCVNSTAAYDFVRSQIFLTHVVNRLKILVLAPHTMYYVRGLQEFALDHIQHYPVAWKVPQEIIDNNDQWEIFAALVRVRLTSIRSQFKDRMFKAYEKGLDINQTLHKLAPRQAVMSDLHRARWAWIVLNIDDFKEACEEGEYESGDFWNFIEDQLASSKKAIAENPQFNTRDLQLTKLSEVFLRSLDEHHRRYPTRVTRGRIGERPFWQETLEEAMGLGQAIYVTSVYAA
ncbi:unnamed protein product [Rhizoctonia solani]|uniref:Uncharacterized protein n=1 Tax=Rhizoctonia solani TaxID=456999 RepID=A0A8H2X131_9AGAM|nr:unnamed protein product [Rhizoctonia solani]